MQILDQSPKCMAGDMMGYLPMQGPHGMAFGGSSAAHGMALFVRIFFVNNLCGQRRDLIGGAFC